MEKRLCLVELGIKKKQVPETNLLEALSEKEMEKGVEAKIHEHFVLERWIAS